jgi:peptide/nickel transport system permease protein
VEFVYFLIRRVLWSLLVLVGLSITIFYIARVMPGDPARMALGPRASQEQVADLKTKMGLDLPLVQQYERFAIGAAHGDLGLSFLTKRPVNDDIAETFAATLELVLVTVLFAFVVGVPLGVLAAAYKDSWIDNLVRVWTILGAVTPSFLLAILLQVLAGYVLHALPTTGRMTADSTSVANLTGLMLVDTLLKGDFAGFVDALKHIFLPVIALSAATTGQIARITRASMIDVARQDYIEAARAFGIPPLVRVFKYTLRPAFVPPLTILGLEFASLIGNAFVVELVFAWPGMASYGVRSILQKDLNAVMGVVMISGLFFVVANFVIDLAVGLVDPRVRIRGQRA